MIITSSTLLQSSNRTVNNTNLCTPMTVLKLKQQCSPQISPETSKKMCRNQCCDSGSGRIRNFRPDPERNSEKVISDLGSSRFEMNNKLSEQILNFSTKCTEKNLISEENPLKSSVADPWPFGVDPDPNPRIHASD
jgi:hypothetical protein